MMVDVIFSMLFAAAASYALWRWWTSISINKTNVAGRAVERSVQPTRYWVHLAFELISALALGVIAISLAIGALFKS